MALVPSVHIEIRVQRQTLSSAGKLSVQRKVEPVHQHPADPGEGGEQGQRQTSSVESVKKKKALRTSHGVARTLVYSAPSTW